MNYRVRNLKEYKILMCRYPNKTWWHGLSFDKPYGRVNYYLRRRPVVIIISELGIVDFYDNPSEKRLQNSRPVILLSKEQL